MSRAPAYLPNWPAALNEQMAAAYCGLSVDTFRDKCPVIPVVITKSRTGKRYLRVRLDEWLLSLEPTRSPKSKIGELMDAARETQGA